MRVTRPSSASKRTAGTSISRKRSSAQAQPSPAPAPIPGGCTDQIQATVNGDAKALGFPIGYTTTIKGDDGKSVVTSMEVTAFELTTLDAALFEIPPGLNAAMNIGEMAKALSDANETRSSRPTPRRRRRHGRRPRAPCESACPSSRTRPRRP